MRLFWASEPRLRPFKLALAKHGHFLPAGICSNRALFPKGKGSEKGLLDRLRKAECTSQASLFEAFWATRRSHGIAFQPLGIC